MFAIDEPSAKMHFLRTADPRGSFSIATTVVPFSAASLSSWLRRPTGALKEGNQRLGPEGPQSSPSRPCSDTDCFRTTSAVSQAQPPVSITLYPASTYLSLKKPAASRTAGQLPIRASVNRSFLQLKCLIFRDHRTRFGPLEFLFGVPIFPSRVPPLVLPTLAWPQ